MLKKQRAKEKRAVRKRRERKRMKIQFGLRLEKGLEKGDGG